MFDFSVNKITYPFYSWTQCVVCGHRIEYIDGKADHHCNERLESRIEAGRQGSGNYIREPSEAERLIEGFMILKGDS